MTPKVFTTLIHLLVLAVVLYAGAGVVWISVGLDSPIGAYLLGLSTGTALGAVLIERSLTALHPVAKEW